MLHASADMSVAPLQAIPPLLREFGVEPSSVFEQVGFDQDTLRDAANRLPFGLVGHLLDECVVASSCPHFGLLVGIRSGPAAEDDLYRRLGAGGVRGQRRQSCGL